MITLLSLRRLLLIVSLCLCAAAHQVGCSRHQQQARPVSLDDLRDGDFMPDHSPPFVPGPKVRPAIDQWVSIHGEVSFLPDGRVFLTRPHEHVATPLRMVVCRDMGHPPGQVVGTVCGILTIQPHYDSAGRLETVYELQQAQLVADADK